MKILSIRVHHFSSFWAWNEFSPWNLDCLWMLLIPTKFIDCKSYAENMNCKKNPFNPYTARVERIVKIWFIKKYWMFFHILGTFFHNFLLGFKNQDIFTQMKMSSRKNRYLYPVLPDLVMGCIKEQKLTRGKNSNTGMETTKCVFSLKWESSIAGSDWGSVYESTIFWGPVWSGCLYGLGLFTGILETDAGGKSLGNFMPSNCLVLYFSCLDTLFSKKMGRGSQYYKRTGNHKRANSQWGFDRL